MESKIICLISFSKLDMAIFINNFYTYALTVFLFVKYDEVSHNRWNRSRKS